MIVMCQAESALNVIVICSGETTVQLEIHPSFRSNVQTMPETANNVYTSMGQEKPARI